MRASWSRRLGKVAGSVSALAALVAWLVTGSGQLLIVPAVITVLWFAFGRILSSQTAVAAANVVAAAAFGIAAIALAQTATATVPVTISVNNQCGELDLGPLGKVRADNVEKRELPRGAYEIELRQDSISIAKGLLPAYDAPLFGVADLEVDGVAAELGRITSYDLSSESGHEIVIRCR